MMDYGAKGPMIIDGYEEVFAVEIDGWCYGIANYPGEVYPELVHRVVKELREHLKLAIDANVIFDIVDIAGRFSKAAKGVVAEKELAFSILGQLPTPQELSEDGMYTLGAVIDRVEQTYGGALKRLEKKWAATRVAA